MKEFITDVLTRFQKGRITLEEATDRLLAEAKSNRKRKATSNRKLKSLCSALQHEQSPSRIRELKTKLSQEFYHGDRVQ